MVGPRRGALSAGPSPRSIKLSYLGITLLTALLLTARYKLLAPEGHAYGGAGQSIGHQAYELAFKAKAVPSTNDKAEQTSTSAEVDDEYGEDDDDWYMVRRTDWPGCGFDLGGSESANISSCPSQASQPRHWDPLSTDTRPITEITVKSCVLPPGLYDVCSPTSSKKEDALRGEWERVDRDLNKRIGITYLYLFVRKSRARQSTCVSSTTS